jgi:predicted RNA-binding protein with PIN domain
MSEDWLIDGYNVLHAFSRKAGGRKVSREALFAALAGFASAGDRRVIVVLDGKGNEAELEAYRTASFEARFSQTVSADSVIEKYLYEHRAKRLMVVTNDRAVAQIARGSGARVTGTDEFYELLGSQKKDEKDTLLKHKTDAHRFNRPFEKKLGDPA